MFRKTRVEEVVKDEIEKTGLYRDGLGKIHKFPEYKPENQMDRQYIFEAICKRREKSLKNFHNMREALLRRTNPYIIKV